MNLVKLQSTHHFSTFLCHVVKNSNECRAFKVMKHLPVELKTYVNEKWKVENKKIKDKRNMF